MPPSPPSPPRADAAAGAATVTEALRRLAPTLETAEAAYGAALREIAALLLGRATLYIAGAPHRLTEVELYFHGAAHADPFTHGDPLQQQVGTWYFHRTGGRYRGGTYKGLDIAFGDPSSFGGILLRGLEPLEGEQRPGGTPALLDGPCVVVDHILAATGSASIEALVLRAGLSIESEDPRAPLRLALEPAARAHPIYETPRIGLTLKKGVTAARRRYLARPYRFLTEPLRIRKGKPYLTTALHLQGRTPDEIAALTGTRRAVLDGHLAAFEAGRRRTGDLAALQALAGELSTSELCTLLGACAGET